MEPISAEDAARDQHPQHKRIFGKKRRLARLSAQIAEAIRVLDEKNP